MNNQNHPENNTQKGGKKLWQMAPKFYARESGPVGAECAGCGH